MYGEAAKRCETCVAEPIELRRSFGCVGRSPAAQWSAEYCPACRGADSRCRSCKGSGRWSVYQCPGRLVQRWAMRVVELSHALSERGILPKPGGLLDQTAWFVGAHRIITRERVRAQKAAMEKANASDK